MSDSESAPPVPATLRQRGPALLLLILPGVLYCIAPFVANRVEPRILGVPFLVAYLIAVTIVTGPLIWLVARLDPAYRSGAPEFVPADDRDSASDFPPTAGDGSVR
ncbi:DUF3311 domain-containing protein [Nocardia sp. CDC153]|uniref:DUF3311 domain-containing protein n=1 Tax=Nocardia sp. CDC153 TaxID=3112167 RepID=UPI002DBD5843|nr:DUF3311 domain-containing protein [Nocardia sp. CDC153]MEC3958323.1 DUF3311 domain-containing protein [Nocardia sp. CDC153]